jgi:acetylglutamate synthase
MPPVTRGFIGKKQAHSCRVSRATLSMLVSKVVKKPAILSELHCRQQAKQFRKDAISKVVNDLNKRAIYIFKAQQVQSLAEAALNQALPSGSPRLSITLRQTITVMKKDLDMRYRRTRKR